MQALFVVLASVLAGYVSYRRPGVRGADPDLIEAALSAAFVAVAAVSVAPHVGHAIDALFGWASQAMIP